MFDRNFDFGRLEPRSAASIAFPTRGVTTALAEELFFAHRPIAWPRPKTACAQPAKQKLSYEVAVA
jgi:hypothetical protein